MKDTSTGKHRIGMAEFQRFGGAMLTPVLFFMFSGIVVAITSVLTNTMLVGDIAAEGTVWYGFWTTVNNGGWTVFNNMEILFAIGLAFGLSNEAKGRAALEAFVLYMTFNVFVNNILTFFGPTFGIDLETAETGIKAIGGITTLDTGFLGAIFVAAVIVWLHNRFFNKRLPEWLGIFQGSALVAAVGFPVMLALAFLFCLVWPTVQGAINSLQYFMSNAGLLGVWIYTFLEKALLPCRGRYHLLLDGASAGVCHLYAGTHDDLPRGRLPTAGSVQLLRHSRHRARVLLHLQEGEPQKDARPVHSRCHHRCAVRHYRAF